MTDGAWLEGYCPVSAAACGNLSFERGSGRTKASRQDLAQAKADHSSAARGAFARAVDRLGPRPLASRLTTRRHHQRDRRPARSVRAVRRARDRSAPDRHPPRASRSGAQGDLRGAADPAGAGPRGPHLPRDEQPERLARHRRARVRHRQEGLPVRRHLEHPHRDDQEGLRGQGRQPDVLPRQRGPRRHPPPARPGEAHRRRERAAGPLVDPLGALDPAAAAHPFADPRRRYGGRPAASRTASHDLGARQRGVRQHERRCVGHRHAAGGAEGRARARTPITPWRRTPMGS